ncbi:MAG: hypothetical protein HYT93_04150 [Parcubacteria group bacterium]|nr:hypothetical protein [Parcubacteria group bacterium]
MQLLSSLSCGFFGQLRRKSYPRGRLLWRGAGERGCLAERSLGGLVGAGNARDVEMGIDAERGAGGDEAVVGVGRGDKGRVLAGWSHGNLPCFGEVGTTLAQDLPKVPLLYTPQNKSQS